MRIRRMRVEDVPQVAAMEREIFSDPWSGQGFLDSLEVPDAVFLVAENEEDAAILGYIGIYLSFEEGEIVNVACSPRTRRRGVGSFLLKGVLEAAAARGVTRLVLEVRSSNEPAIRLYERFGFAAVGIRKNFYAQPREDALVMVCERSSGGNIPSHEAEIVNLDGSFEGNRTGSRNEA